MPGTDISEKLYFTIFGNMTMTKSLIPIRVFFPRAKFYLKKIDTFRKIIKNRRFIYLLSKSGRECKISLK